MEIITRYCREECYFTCFKFQFHRYQKQIYPFCKTSYNHNNVHLAFRCVFGALSDVYKCKISFLPNNGDQPYIWSISPPFPQQSKPSYSNAGWSKRKKNSKASFAPCSFAYSSSFYVLTFLFILLHTNFNVNRFSCLVSFSKTLMKTTYDIKISQILLFKIVKFSRLNFFLELPRCLITN